MGNQTQQVKAWPLAKKMWDRINEAGLIYVVVRSPQGSTPCLGASITTGFFFSSFLLLPFPSKEGMGRKAPNRFFNNIPISLYVSMNVVKSTKREREPPSNERYPTQRF